MDKVYKLYIDEHYLNLFLPLKNSMEFKKCS